MSDRTESAIENSRSRRAHALGDPREYWHQVEGETRKLAAVMELMSALDHHDNVRSAANEAAYLLREEFDAARVVVYWRSRSSSPVQLIGDTQTESSNEALRLMAAAGEEAVFHREHFRWLDEHNEEEVPLRNRVGLLAIQQFAMSENISRIVGIPLARDGKESVGAILIVDAAREWEANWLSLLCEPIATKFTSLQALEPTAIESRIREFLRWCSATRPIHFVVIVFTILVLACLPVRYRIPAELEIQPTLRRFIAVPFDGPLKRAHVRPGDSVHADQILAEIDPREIEYELAGINAELERSRQEQRGLLADRDVAGSQLAAWDARRFEFKSNLLTLRQHNLEIRSPISGVVVNGDWKQSEGMPLARGETLFEIAPLDQLLVEVAIPEEDIHHVRVGMDVEFVVNAMPEKSLSGTIRHVHPSAEIRDHTNVYLAEVALRNEDGLFRPGMRGYARIVSDRHTLAWNMLHKPWHALRRTVGW